MAYTIDQLLANNGRPPVTVVDANKTGFNSLTSDTFLKLLITQLQNQDPTNPTDSDELLGQISQMQSLQASLELQSTLKTVSVGQQLSNGAALLGKTVIATNGDNQEVTGVVSRVIVKDSKTYVDIGGAQILLTNITQVQP